MAKFEYILCLVMLAMAVVATRGRPKIPYKSKQRDCRNTEGKYTKVAHSKNASTERENIIEESRCGVPRDDFIRLNPMYTQEQVIPGAVWLKRCKGLCEFDIAGSCVPSETVTRYIPVRIYNAETNTETYANYTVEDHVKCSCKKPCLSPRVYVPCRGSCQCPNIQDRRKCSKQLTQNMTWNPFKCICEELKSDRR